MDFETTVRLQIYSIVAETTQVPSPTQVAAALDCTVLEVRAAFAALAETRILVLEPGVHDRIRMAPPFSGVPTPFRIETAGKSYFANCIWDAYGILAALRQDGVIRTQCGFSQVALQVSVREAQPSGEGYPAHFALPAAKWWEDIIYT